MKYSSNKYFVEKYEKCCVCGKLLYSDKKIMLNPEGKEAMYCSDWCHDWEMKQKEKEAK